MKKTAAKGKKPLGGVLAPENLPYQMFLLVQQMSRKFQQILEPYELTPLHWGVLCCLWKNDGLRTNEIAQRLEQLGGTITVGLDAMQRRGLIRRTPDPLDRRVLHIHVTDKGKSLQKVLEPRVKVLIGQIFGVLSDAEYAALNSLVSRLRQHLA